MPPVLNSSTRYSCICVVNVFHRCQYRRMNTGTFAEYSFGSGTEAIMFLYVVQEGDSTEALDAWDAPANGELSVKVAGWIVIAAEGMGRAGGGAAGY